MMRVDAYTHFIPTRFFKEVMSAGSHKDIGKRMRTVPMLVDHDERFRVMDRFEGYEQVLSISTPPIEAFAPPQKAADMMVGTPHGATGCML